MDQTNFTPLLNFSRESSDYRTGLSPRGGLALLSAAKAWAYLDRRDAVLPEDIQTMLEPVSAHRLQAGSSGAPDAAVVVAPLLREVAIP